MARQCNDHLRRWCLQEVLAQVSDWVYYNTLGLLYFLLDNKEPNHSHPYKYAPYLYTLSKCHP